MVGQKNVINIFNSFDIATMPKTAMVIGANGSGKHTIVKEFSGRVNIPMVDITDIISFDTISNIYESTTMTLYVINATNLDERKQNSILKFLEEPPKYAVIFVLCETRANVLDTIVNRCYIIEMEAYAKEELMKFIQEKDFIHADEILEVCETPYQIIITDFDSITKIKELCKKIATKLCEANYYNSLTIVNKLNCQGEMDKYDCSIFLKVLLKTLVDTYQETRNTTLVKLYNIVNDTMGKFSSGKMLKENLLVSMITKMWKVSRV